MIKENINKLYEVFLKYPLNPNINKCDCGCIPEKEGSKLYHKPLRELTDNDLSHYRISAMYTWGELEDYKHFLPRILELFALDKNNNGLDLDEIINKLKYGDWETWPQEEQQAITNMIKSVWSSYINEKESEVWKFEFEAFVFFLSIEELFQLWKPSTNISGLKNFVHFYFHHGNELPSILKKLNIKQEEIQNLFLSFFKREKLYEVLENEFFRVENQDIEYAERISIVLQMIETH